MINLIDLECGTKLKLVSGAIVEVIENMGDGQWVNVRYIQAADAESIGTEALCYSQDIASLAD